MLLSLGSQAIVTTRYELDESPIAQILQLLANLWPDVLVAGIEVAEMPVEGIDLIESELPLAERLDALHHIEQPTTRLQRLASEEESLLPFLKNGVLRANDTVLNDVYLADLWHLADQNVRTNPTRAARSGFQGFALLDNVTNEEMLGDDEQVHDRQRFQVVVHQQQIWIVACNKALPFRVVGAVSHLGPELSLLALEFEFLVACRAEEISNRTVVWKLRHLRVTAMRTIGPQLDPCLGPRTCALRAAGVRQ